MEKMNHLNKEWLYQKYVVENLSTYDIGKIVDRNPKRIYEKLRDFGIPTRPRGQNLKGEDNYMAGENVINPFFNKKHTDETKKILSEKAKISKPWLKGENNGMYGATGDKNPMYKDGSSPLRQRMYVRGEGKDFLKSILKRDGYKCRRCGAEKKGRKSLHVHHVIPWAGNEDLRFDANNVLVLCGACHRWVHSSKNINGELLG